MKNMPRNKKTTFIKIIAICMVVLTFAACSENFYFDGRPKLKDEKFIRIPPPLLLSGYVGDVQEERTAQNGHTIIDFTNLENGYVVASFKGEQKAKFRFGVGEDQYTYDLRNDGEFEVYPLSMGSGKYTFSVFTHTGESDLYEYFLTTEQDVVIAKEQAPFTVPNQNVNYNASSLCVELSYKITKNCSTDTEVVSQIYFWAKTNLSYYQERADDLANLPGYTPDLDEVVEMKKGICYDYAALVAAMLRINGIPCQLIKGDVQSSTDSEVLYHAWNMIWLDDVGWVAVKVPATPDEWNMVDLTFASAKSVDVATLLDEYNYTQLSVH